MQAGIRPLVYFPPLFLSFGGEIPLWTCFWIFARWFCLLYILGERESNIRKQWERGGLFTYGFKDFIYLFLERGEQDREREREKYQCVVAPWASPTGELPRNLGMCPDQESNWLPFGLQASTQSTELYQPRIFSLIYSNNIYWVASIC